MKERPILFSAPMVRAILDGSKTQTRRVVKGEALKFLESGERPYDFGGHIDSKALCPYGQPSDRLWVRETWSRHTETFGDFLTETVYRADPVTPHFTKWKPSIFMPRWASRITLEITGIRVERLQDITNNEALAEGTPDLRTIENNWDMVRCYQELWGQINGAGSWAANPWVFVLDFLRVFGQ